MAVTTDGGGSSGIGIRILVLLSLLATAMLIVLVAMRVGYPHELEWMEGAMVDEALRVRRGEPTYGPPTLEHVPFLYTPLLYWLGALLTTVFGEGFVALRAVSIAATAVAAWLLARMAVRAAGRREAGVLAIGLFAAGYGWLRTWYDLGRNDMLFVAAMLGAHWSLRERGPRPALLAAGCALLAFLAKQTAVFWLPAVAVAALLRDRRTGLWFAGAAAAAILAAIGIGQLATDGWFTFYVFTMPSLHARVGDRWLGFWTEDLLPIAPLLLVALAAVAAQWRNGARAEALAQLAWLGGGVGASYASRLHVGGYDNVMLYGFVAVLAVAPALAWSAPSPRGRTIVQLLVLVQFVSLAVDLRHVDPAAPRVRFDPRAVLPSARHLRASEELLAFARAQQGEVWLPFHGWLGPRAGKRPFAHAQALYDLLPWSKDAPADDRALTAIGASVDRWLRQQQLAAVVLDLPHGPLLEDVFRFGFERYQRAEQPLLADPGAIAPVVGLATTAPYALLSRR